MGVISTGITIGFTGCPEISGFSSSTIPGSIPSGLAGPTSSGGNVGCDGGCTGNVGWVGCGNEDKFGKTISLISLSIVFLISSSIFFSLSFNSRCCFIISIFF